MTQKEIRDQVENLIRMNKTFSNLQNTICSKDLTSTVYSLFNAEAQNLIQNHKTTSLIHQWNRQTGNSQFEGDVAHSLGKLLEKLNIKSFADLFASNYVREVSKVQYFGHIAELNKVGAAAISMVNFFNDLASKGLIRAVLTPLTSVELVGGKIVLVSYVAIDQQNEAVVQSIYGSMQFIEGGLPPEFV